MFWIWTAAIATSVVLYFWHRYISRSSFKNAGVNYLTPIPPFGNNTRSFLQLEHFNGSTTRLYNAFPEDRFVGHYDFLDQLVIIRDLDLIKQIAVKDFDSFTDHRHIFGDTGDDFFGKSLFSMRGSKWRDMRATLSPAFTSSKIKLMVPFMEEVGHQMTQVLKDKIEASEINYIDFDARDLATRYTNDVIASCAYGIKTNSHSDENNEFYVRGKALTNLKFDFQTAFKLAGYLCFPKFMKIFNVSLFSLSEANFFKNIMKNVMKDREEKNILRPDMIHLLMEAKKGSLSHAEEATVEDAGAGFATVKESAIGRTKSTRVWDLDELVAQALVFFLAGFDTVSTAITFVLYELARNPEIQNKLAAEIKQFDDKNRGKLDYNNIQQLNYLDMVVSECLRLYSPIALTNRQCLKDYNLGKTNSKATTDYIVRKGQVVSFPIWSIHRDPKYYPEPEKFIPERFSEENRPNIKPFSYFPFGQGPRNCIGSRFALCELKVMVYQLIKDFEVSPNEKTTIPFELDIGNFNIRLKGGHSLRLNLRK